MNCFVNFICFATLLIGKVTFANKHALSNSSLNTSLEEESFLQETLLNLEFKEQYTLFYNGFVAFVIDNKNNSILYKNDIGYPYQDEQN